MINDDPSRYTMIDHGTCVYPTAVYPEVSRPRPTTFAQKKRHVLPHTFPVRARGSLFVREFASKGYPGFAGEMRWENRGTMRQLGNS